MRNTQVMAGLAALATIATASPLNAADMFAQNFRVNQVEVGKKFKSGAIALAAAYAKYHVAAPSTVTNAAAAAVQSGSVTANPQQYDSEYLCSVTVGTQTLSLDFDTGSADLWVFSTELPAAQQGSHTLYDCKGTAKSGYTWTISYGDGSGAAGNVFADTVKIGSVTATSQAVEAATSASSSFVSGNGDGLVGLAFSSINMVKPQAQTTFFDTVKASLASPLFGVDLKHGAPGSYDFGFIDSSKYTGSLVYTAVDNSQGFWGFTAGGYSVGNTTSTTSFSAIADTGTSLMLLDDAIVSTYYKQVVGSSNSAADGGYIFPCGASLPAFSVTIGGKKATVPGTYFNYSPASSGKCYGGLQSNSGIGFSILGDVFLKSQYVVFNSQGPQIGFAPQS